jgi:hypothetical protein
MKKIFRTFGQNYLKQRHFELFSKSGGFYSLRSDPDPVFFQRSDPDPDPVKMDRIRQHCANYLVVYRYRYRYCVSSLTKHLYCRIWCFRIPTINDTMPILEKLIYAVSVVISGKHINAVPYLYPTEYEIVKIANFFMWCDGSCPSSCTGIIFFTIMSFW